VSLVVTVAHDGHHARSGGVVARTVHETREPTGRAKNGFSLDQYLPRFQIYLCVHTIPSPSPPLPREIPSCCKYCIEHSVSIKFREFLDWLQVDADYLSWFVQYYNYFNWNGIIDFCTNDYEPAHYVQDKDFPYLLVDS